jgi:hypothetical protein
MRKHERNAGEEQSETDDGKADRTLRPRAVWQYRTMQSAKLQPLKNRPKERVEFLPFWKLCVYLRLKFPILMVREKQKHYATRSKDDADNELRRVHVVQPALSPAFGDFELIVLIRQLHVLTAGQ